MKKKYHKDSTYHRVFKHTRTEMQEIDYWHKLKPEEQQYLNQFLCEYYQGDFGFSSPIHDPGTYKKECQVRNNAAKRQMHSIGSDMLEKAIHEARARSNAYKNGTSKYYSPDEYTKGFDRIDDFDFVEEEDSGD